MHTFRIATLGCKVNQCESQLLREQLLSLGMREVSPEESPDLCIVNTCAVTATAVGKSVRAVRRAKRECPDSLVAAIGCGVSESAQRYSEADVLVPQGRKQDAVELILGKKSSLEGTSALHGHARAFLKIQDGCDSFCTYCIVPYLRSKPVSKPIKMIEREAADIAGNGYRELVLAGIHLGSYGGDLGDGSDLVTVVERLLEAGYFPRLRLSGVEANEVDDRLIKLLAQDNALCPHLHIPLQSGSARVLRDMGRPYTPESYIEVVNRVRESVPNVSITTDLIAGFPTEDDSDFIATRELCRKALFSRIHAFPYSRREGTYAARRWKSLPAAILSSRSRELRILGEELADSFARLFEGERVRVVAESRGNGMLVEGCTDHYVRARVHGAQTQQGEIVEGVVTSVTAGVLEARVPETTCGRNE